MSTMVLRIPFRGEGGGIYTIPHMIYMETIAYILLCLCYPMSRECHVPLYLNEYYILTCYVIYLNVMVRNHNMLKIIYPFFKLESDAVTHDMVVSKLNIVTYL